MWNKLMEMNICYDFPSADSGGRGWGGSRANLEDRFYNPKQDYYTKQDFADAIKAYTLEHGAGGKTGAGARVEFQRELEALAKIEGVGVKGAFRRYLEDKADAAAAEAEEGADEAEDEGETAMEEAMKKRQSRRKSILTSTYGLLQPAPTRKKRLLGA